MQNLQGITILVMLLGIFSTIFWMVVSWRAMRAHEKLADAVEQLTQRQAANSGNGSRTATRRLSRQSKQIEV